MNLTPINEVQINKIYFTHTRNYPVQVMSLSRYGHNCTIPMVTYMVLCATGDAKAGQLFTLEESLFLKKMKECIDFDYSAIDFITINAALGIFEKYLDEDVLADRAGSVEIYAKQKLRQLPINLEQVSYIAKATSTPMATWCSVSLYMRFGRGHTPMSHALEKNNFYHSLIRQEYLNV